MTANFRAVVYKNRYIADEVIKYGSIQGTSHRPQGGFFMKKASEETLIERDRQQRYDSRRNRCNVCNQTKSLGTGECGCY